MTDPVTDPASVPWWATLISGAGGASLFAAVTTWIKSRTTVEVAEVSQETKLQEAHIREDSAQFQTNASFAEKAYARSEEERQRISGERNRLANENVALIEEVTKLAFENVAIKEELAEVKADLRELQREVRECHEGRADDMRRTAEWVRDLMAGRQSEAPRPRSITPKDMPAIQSSNAVNANKET